MLRARAFFAQSAGDRPIFRHALAGLLRRGQNLAHQLFEQNFVPKIKVGRRDVGVVDRSTSISKHVWYTSLPPTYHNYSSIIARVITRGTKWHDHCSRSFAACAARLTNRFGFCFFSGSARLFHNRSLSQKMAMMAFAGMGFSARQVQTTQDADKINDLSSSKIYDGALDEYELDVLCSEIQHLSGQHSEACESDELSSRTPGVEWQCEHFQLGPLIAKGCCAAVHAAKQKSTTDETFNLAIKMMFNYDTNSEASNIQRRMYKELLPARSLQQMSPHYNIVDMLDWFIDDMPLLPDAFSHYPDALPYRYSGYGRNKTLFILMKRYECSLAEYLKTHTLTVTESLLMLAQLLEAIVHLQHHDIAHRDLKADNVLVEVVAGQPHVVLTDFGCALSDETFALRVPCVSSDMCRGGNSSLMAPEIATATPWCVLDYRKSDLWACGTLAYEMFAVPNPFYWHDNRPPLDSRTYTEQQLPDLTDNVPEYVTKLIKVLLRRDPNERPDSVTAADMVQVLLWCPATWRDSLRSGGAAPDRLQVMHWLLTLTAGLVCNRTTHTHTQPACQLQRTFLSRADISRVMNAVDMLFSL